MYRGTPSTIWGRTAKGAEARYALPAWPFIDRAVIPVGVTIGLRAKRIQRLLHQPGGIARDVRGKLAQVQSPRLLTYPISAGLIGAQSPTASQVLHRPRDTRIYDHQRIASTAGNHGVKPGASAGVDIALTNIVASFTPTR